MQRIAHRSCISLQLVAVRAKFRCRLLLPGLPAPYGLCLWCRCLFPFRARHDQRSHSLIYSSCRSLEPISLRPTCGKNHRLAFTQGARARRIAVGAFAGPSFFGPIRSVFEVKTRLGKRLFLTSFLKGARRFKLSALQA